MPSQHGILADHADVHDHCVAFHLGSTSPGTPTGSPDFPSVLRTRSVAERFTRDERGTLRRETAGGAEVTGSVARVDPCPPPAVDERELRAVQAAVGVLLLGAFVFRIPELVYLVTIVVGVGALLGTRANVLHAAYRGRRRAPPQVGARGPSRRRRAGARPARDRDLS